jgi:hypothetical protein
MLMERPINRCPELVTYNLAAPGPISTACCSTHLIANSNYNALQAKLTKRFSKGFTALISYTYSKVLDVEATRTTAVFVINRTRTIVEPTTAWLVSRLSSG